MGTYDECMYCAIGNTNSSAFRYHTGPHLYISYRALDFEEYLTQGSICLHDLTIDCQPAYSAKEFHANNNSSIEKLAT